MVLRSGSVTTSCKSATSDRIIATQHTRKYISSAPAHIRVADYRSCWSRRGSPPSGSSTTFSCRDGYLLHHCRWLRLLDLNVNWRWPHQHQRRLALLEDLPGHTPEDGADCASAAVRRHDHERGFVLRNSLGNSVRRSANPYIGINRQAGMFRGNAVADLGQVLQRCANSD